MCSSLSLWTSLPHRWQLPNHPVTISKGVFFLNHSNEQTAPFSASNLQCSILIFPKRYQAGICFPLSDGSTPYSSCWDIASQCLSYHKTSESPLGEFLIFSATPNRLEIMRLSNSMVKALRSIWGDFQCTSNFVLQLQWQVPSDGLANVQSSRFWWGWRREYRLSVEGFMVFANSFFICLFICCFRVLIFLFIGVFSFLIPVSFTTLLPCCWLCFFTFLSPCTFQLPLGPPPLS